MKTIVEKKLGIPADYQQKALHSKNFLQSNWHNNKLSILADILTNTKARTVMDIGTGSGNFELTFYPKLKKILGVDYNDEALIFLKKQLKKYCIRNVNLICRDLRELDKLKTTSKFDLIILVDVIEHIKIEEAKKVVPIFRKFLNPKGKVCIITPNYNSVWILLEKLLDIFTLFPHFDGEQHLAKYHHKNLKTLFESSGYTTCQLVSFNLFSYLIPIKTLSSRMALAELKLPFFAGNLLLGLFEHRKD